jgi:ribosomal protein L11 methyltransferase
MSGSDSNIRHAVLALVRGARRRQTPADIVSAIRKTSGVSPRRVRRAIHSLLEDQHLIYSYEMGCSFLLENTLGIWQPAPHIWILPQGCVAPKPVGSGEILIRLKTGAAFGCEGHPTTRLCLQALNLLSRSTAGAIQGRGIDIGTGSGILALAAAKLGWSPILALDTDPCARHEARANIRINHLAACVDVSDQPFTATEGCYHIVMANLRFPTLKEMLPWVMNHLAAEGALVVSGYTLAEAARLEACFEAAGLFRHWGGAEKRWAGGHFKRSAV